MSSLQHHKFLSRSPGQGFHHHHRVIPIRYATSITTITCTLIKDNPNSNHLVSQPQRVSRAPPVIPLTANDPGLKSTWSHRGWVATGCATVLFSLAKAAVGAASVHIWLEPVLAGYMGYILADLGSGVYHWSIDNYGDASTPGFGSQIEAFQGHHKWPWTITRREFANNLHSLARVVAFSVLPVELVCSDPVVLGFVGMFSGCIMFSQQFHAWAHSTKSKLPAAVVALQDAGVLVSRGQHADHHRPPYNNNYCIVSGIWNDLLDRNKVLEVLEMVVYFKLGVKPRSWSDPNSAWTEDEDAEITI
ncbi:unnamed protein product [Linum tenue]|uniref:Lipid desaturase domain-containing protein n=2 Tax=Linum tenue TaxID=586396 RepID=A0AAV0H3U3_9ROSI|nr:unnamed protein product [Linum tenue]